MIDAPQTHEDQLKEHVIYLGLDKGEYMTAEGLVSDPTMRVTCSCGQSISGLKDAAAVAAIIKSHGRN